MSIGESIEFSVKADVFMREFYPESYVRVRRIRNQIVQRGGRAVFCLHLDWNQIFCRAHEKIHFQLGVFLFVVEKFQALRDEHLGDKIFINRAFVHPKIPVFPQIFA